MSEFIPLSLSNPRGYPLFQFTFGLTKAVQKVKDRQVSVGMRKGVEMACNWNLKMAIADRAWVLRKAVAESVLGLGAIEKAASRAFMQ